MVLFLFLRKGSQCSGVTEAVLIRLLVYCHLHRWQVFLLGRKEINALIGTTNSVLRDCKSHFPESVLMASLVPVNLAPHLCSSPSLSAAVLLLLSPTSREVQSASQPTSVASMQYIYNGQRTKFFWFSEMSLACR